MNDDSLRNELLKAASKVIQHPHAQVCKRWAVLQIFDALERSGGNGVSVELIRAVINGSEGDSAAISLLESEQTSIS